MAKSFIIIGFIFIAIGLLWPVLSKLPFGRLPGDISIQREGFSFYFPLATSILLSLVFSLLMWFFRK